MRGRAPSVWRRTRVGPWGLDPWTRTDRLVSMGNKGRRATTGEFRSNPREARAIDERLER